MHHKSNTDVIRGSAENILKENQTKKIGKLSIASLDLEKLKESVKDEQIDPLGFVLKHNKESTLSFKFR